MTMVESMRSCVGRSAAAAGMALLTVMAMAGAGNAQSSQADRERQQVFQNSAAAANQRSQQLKEGTNSQQQLLNYQIRKSQRTNRQMQCRSAGLPPNC